MAKKMLYLILKYTTLYNSFISYHIFLYYSSIVRVQMHYYILILIRKISFLEYSF